VLRQGCSIALPSEEEVVSVYCVPLLFARPSVKQSDVSVKDYPFVRIGLGRTCVESGDRKLCFFQLAAAFSFRVLVPTLFSSDCDALWREAFFV